ncbi:hypothetical protein [Arthrobacter crystallopoietes]|uniref:Secreted protein n=1 Tax=Crystallibacter crystallopoietes TaxID=37928 RepID=A0A1H1FU71_9MICC|nr:hypothetical protein [Arthrobacter crystallopoietes]SDR04370.1 hypothetical protein SAMN04489742_3650 [Arthrobacter crystallopoietes]
MATRPALGALTASLIFLLTACGSAGTSQEAAPPVEQDPNEWAKQQFGEKRWGAPGVHSAAGGIGPGAGMDFTPGNAGWYDIGMACEGTDSMTVTVTSADGDLGTGNTDCGSEVTTTMELPASQITIAVEGTETQGQWAIAIAPAEAPKP